MGGAAASAIATVRSTDDTDDVTDSSEVPNGTVVLSELQAPTIMVRAPTAASVLANRENVECLVITERYCFNTSPCRLAEPRELHRPLGRGADVVTAAT